jgi:hypothetical protein
MLIALDGSLEPRVVDAKMAISIQLSVVEALHGQGQLLTLTFRYSGIDHRGHRRGHHPGAATTAGRVGVSYMPLFSPVLA